MFIKFLLSFMSIDLEDEDEVRAAGVRSHELLPPPAGSTPHSTSPSARGDDENIAPAQQLRPRKKLRRLTRRAGRN